jgi:hypothetical protein
MSRELFKYLNEMNTELLSNEAKKVTLLENIQQQLSQLISEVDKLECRSIERELIGLQDMRDYIYSNPYLKDYAAKNSTFMRYVGIFKNNHAQDLDKKVFCHHDNPLDDTVLAEALDNITHELFFFDR